MFAIIQGRPRIICDICLTDAKLKKSEIVASVAQLKGHMPQGLIVCSESCGIIAEHKLEVKPLQRLPLRDALETLLRE